VTQFAFDVGDSEEFPLAASDLVFGDLFNEQRTSIYRLALMMSGDVFVAEEITAEVFARVLPRWRHGHITDPVFYLRRAVVNEVRSRLRRRANERRALARYSSRPDHQHAGGQREALSEPLIAALQQLPVRARTIVVLRFHDDLSVAEVARVVGAPVGTVKTQTSRALRTLRGIMEETS
jgi:RNA polymerase sigma factor (sigma-70 family)